MGKEIPVLYERKKECCGCAACSAACPKKAIKMIEDEEGFLYPEIDSQQCICCYRCCTVCSIKQKVKNC